MPREHTVWYDDCQLNLGSECCPFRGSMLVAEGILLPPSSIYIILRHPISTGVLEVVWSAVVFHSVKVWGSGFRVGLGNS